MRRPGPRGSGLFRRRRGGRAPEGRGLDGEEFASQWAAATSRPAWDWRRGCAGAALGAVIGWLVADLWGVPVGCVLGAVAARWLPRSEPAAFRAERHRAAADLPFAADLLAAALHAGATPDGAARVVGEALGGPLGARLIRTARALRMGAPAAEAWGYVGAVPGADRLVRAAGRSGHTGAGFADALTRVADDLRDDRQRTVEAAAQRAGVLVVLPLGLCFLPAFVLTGLVPVVVTILRGVLDP